MGDKINAKTQMEAFNVPCVPGSNGEVKDIDDAYITAKKIGIINKYLIFFFLFFKTSNNNHKKNGNKKI